MTSEKISIQGIVRLLTEVLNHERTREEVSNLATTYRHQLEQGTAVYDPVSDESVIWEAILFMEGIDLRDSPEDYLHNESDVHIFLSELLRKSV